MGKPTGFLEYKRRVAENSPVEQRIKNYKEYGNHLRTADLQQQGARCMDCGIPFCHTSFGCPVYNLIPEWNDLVYRGLWKEAYFRLEQTNNFPEITGRVCPAPCETSCTLSVNDSPVTIKQIELAIIERAFEKGWVLPRPPLRNLNQSVAVVGSGPAGLAAAQQLRRFGYDVTIFERAPKMGGLLRYGIPDFKLEKWVIDRRLEQLEQEGIRFETNVTIGDDLSSRYLVKSFDVVLLAIGAEEPRDLQVKGRELEGIHFAMDYLKKSNLLQDQLISKSEIIDAENQKVLVLGGGDTGSDCVGTANRQMAKEVQQFEILEKPLEWKESFNPEWPKWPNILRTSSSHEEGCHRDWGILTKGFQKGLKHRLKGTFSRVEWQKDASGNPVSMKELENSEFEAEYDMVLLAMGFVHPVHRGIINQADLNKDSKGNIKIDNSYKTSAENIFAAGDASMGASLVVRAIYHGREAAESVHKYLTEK